MRLNEILNAYRVLGEVKVTTLEVNEVLKVLKARKVMRPHVESFEAFIKDMQEKSAGADEQRMNELNAAVNEELLKDIEAEFERISEESVAKLAQENGLAMRDIDLLGIMV